MDGTTTQNLTYLVIGFGMAFVVTMIPPGTLATVAVVAGRRGGRWWLAVPPLLALAAYWLFSFWLLFWQDVVT